MELLSARNPRVQQLRRLLRQSKVRDEAGLFVLEGAGLLAEALRAGHEPAEVFVDVEHVLDHQLTAALETLGVTVWGLEASVLEAVASTKSPQPVLTVVSRFDVALARAVPDSATFVVVAAGVREPGNAGTIIRTAAAAGAEAVLFCDGSVDVFNPKVVRATAGALFRIAVVCDAKPAELWPMLTNSGLELIGLSGRSLTSYTDLDLTQPIALVLGNEAHGLSDSVLKTMDQQVSIPMSAGVESINVSAAAAAVCFEVSRQRR